MDRKLASIQEVSKIESIEGADFIEKATILGWDLVVRKGEFKEGDKAVYFEIDSMIPNREEFAFLKDKDKDYTDAEFICRLKTKKMRGVLSQGLAMPVKSIHYADVDLPLGTDVSETLGVQKYEPPETPRTGGDIMGNFPWFLPKTDEIRIQSAPELIEEMQGIDVYISAKCDGTSATYYWDEDEDDLVVCSRNNRLKEGDNVYWRIADKYGLRTIMKIYHGLAIQGEICGPGLQKNPMALSELELFVFNIYGIHSKGYYSFHAFKAFAAALGLPIVPIDAHAINFKFTMKDLLEMAKGIYGGTHNAREGIVIRPMDERYSEVLQGRMSFKVINNDYLLKE